MYESQRKGNAKEEIRVNMRVETEEQCYICPKCGHVVEWQKEALERAQFYHRDEIIDQFDVTFVNIAGREEG